MYHPIALEFIAQERIAQLRQLARSCQVHVEPQVGLREHAAGLLVRLGMLLDHGAAERAATHVHAV
jgi:hypothetical protein